MDRDPEHVALAMANFESRMRHIAKVHVQSKAQEDDVVAELQIKFLRAIRCYRYKKNVSLLGLLDRIGQNYNYDLNRRAATRPVETPIDAGGNEHQFECKASTRQFKAHELFDTLTGLSTDARVIASYCAEHPGKSDYEIAVGLTKVVREYLMEKSNKGDLKLVADDAHAWTVARVELAKAELADALGVRLPRVMAQTRIQIGYESPDKKIRLTPIDQKLGLNEAAISLVRVLILALDSNDLQPGDGEIDIPITDSVRVALRNVVPVLGEFLPADGNVFFKLR